MPLNLSELKLNSVATIHSIDVVNAADRQKLFACGFLPGAKVRVVRIAPIGDPMQICLVGSNVVLSIRKAEGCKIIVKQ